MLIEDYGFTTGWDKLPITDKLLTESLEEAVALNEKHRTCLAINVCDIIYQGLFLGSLKYLPLKPTVYCYILVPEKMYSEETYEKINGFVDFLNNYLRERK